MKYALVVLILLSMGASFAKDRPNTDRSIKITITSIQSEAAEYRKSWVKGGGRNTNVTVVANASDGNRYQLAGKGVTSSSLAPGEYSATIGNKGITVCRPTNKGTCQDLEFQIVKAEKISN